MPELIRLDNKIFKSFQLIILSYRIKHFATGQPHLYVGSTFDLIKRVWEHKNKVIPGFTAQYNVHMLVYYETHSTYIEAARREKRFKNWRRQWIINLIEVLNPKWRDLYEEICS